MKTAKGLHLWEATFGYNTFFITTRLRAPHIAVKRAQQAAHEQGMKTYLKRLDYRGTVDA